MNCLKLDCIRNNEIIEYCQIKMVVGLKFENKNHYHEISISISTGISIFGEIWGEFDFRVCVLAWHVIHIFCFCSIFLIYFNLRIVLPNINIF